MVKTWIKKMVWCTFLVFLLMLFLDYVYCGQVCKYGIEGIEGFHDEIKVDGTVHTSATVFPIVFLVEGHPLSDWRHAVLQNYHQVHYFTVYSALHTTNEIRASRTVPVGVSEVLEIGPESVNECTFYLTVSVGPSVLETTKISTVTTFRSTTTSVSSMLPSTVRRESTAMSTMSVMPIRTTPLSSASSSVRTTESVTPGVCQYEIQGIDGFAGEISVEGPVFLATTVFSIIFFTKGNPLPDGPAAILKNLQEVHYFTVTVNTNEIMAYRTVPLGTSEVLEIGPESVDECTFYLTVTVGSLMTKTLVSTSRLMSSLFSSTKTTNSTFMYVSQTGGTELSTTLSTPWTTESATLGVCKYELQKIDGFAGEIRVEGPVFIATAVFSIVFLIQGNPLPDQPLAVLKNPQEVHYFTVTVNTNEVMSYRTVPLGTSEVLEISPESVDECTFYLTVTVGPSMTKTLVSTSRLTSSVFPSITPLSTAMSTSQTRKIKLSTTPSTAWTKETVTLGVCKYKIQGIKGFVGEISVDGPLFIVTTVFHIKFLMDGNPLPDSKRAVLNNRQEVQYFTVTTNTNEIMTTQTVPIGTSEVLEIGPDRIEECTFYLTVNVQDPVITTKAKTTSAGLKSSTTPPMSSSAFISMYITSTVTGHPTTNSTQLTTILSTSAKAFSAIISSASREATAKSMTSSILTVPSSNSSNLASFTLSTSVNSRAVSPMVFSGVVFRGAFRLISILFYGIILSCF